MTLTKTMLKLILLLSLTTQQVCGQKGKLTTYNGSKFALDYPSFWQITNENGVLNFFPKENFGSVTVSYHSGIDFPMDQTKKFIIELYEIKDRPENVKMTKKGDVVEFYYDHIDKNVKWITKAFRKSTDFYLLTINCDVNKWDINKETFLKVINSFRLN